MLNFPFVCRLCLIPTSPNNSIEIFDDSNEIPDKILELTEIQVLNGDGLPQEVCGLCRQNLDLSVMFKRQVCQADLMLREHLASTEEIERCETPTITGDVLTEDQRNGRLPVDGENPNEKDVQAEENSSHREGKPNPSSDDCRRKKEDDWAVAEPWPDLGNSDVVDGTNPEEDISSHQENGVKDTKNTDTEESHIPITHIKLEGGGTLLFSLSEEEQDENSNSINDLDLSCSEVDESLEEFKCPHCPKAFSSKKGVAGHQREHPEHSKRKRARDRNRTRDQGKLSENQSDKKPQDILKDNGEDLGETNSQSMDESSLGDADSQPDEQKDGLRRSSRSTLGKAPERHVVPHYCCTKCERMYNDEAALENHMKMQHGMTYKCNHCGKKFVLKDSLESHIKNFHLDLIIQKDIKKQQDRLSSSNNQPTIMSHEEVKNTDRPRRNPNRSRRKSGHVCDICGKSFENRSHMFSHMRSHKSTVHLCEICGKTVSLNTYPAHKRAHLNAESHEVFPCDTCGKKFNNKISLRTHKTSYHGTLKFTCEVCGKQFTTMALMKHHQNIHSGKKDHACQVCGKAFSLKVTLKSHMRIHTGEMPYGCENCGKHFTWKTTYRKHLETCKKTQNDIQGTVPPSRSETSRLNVPHPSPPPPVNFPTVPYMPQLPQELPLDYSEEAKYHAPIDYREEVKYHAPIDYREEGKYRFLPISIPDSKGLNLRDDIKYPYQQPLNFSGDVKLYRDVKSPM